MYLSAGEKHAVLVLCDVQGLYIDCNSVSIITWYLERYGHFDDVILNWHQAYSLGGATHTPNLDYCLHANAFLCKTATYK